MSIFSAFTLFILTIHEITTSYTQTTGRVISQNTVPNSAAPEGRRPRRLITVHFRVADETSKMTMRSQTQQVGDRIELWVDAQSHRAYLTRPTPHWTRWALDLLALGVIACLSGILLTGIRTTRRIAMFDPETQHPAIWARILGDTSADEAGIPDQRPRLTEIACMITSSDAARLRHSRHVLLRARRREMPSIPLGDTVGLFRIASPFRRPAMLVVHDPAHASWFPATIAPLDVEPAGVALVPPVVP